MEDEIGSKPDDSWGAPMSSPPRCAPVDPELPPPWPSAVCGEAGHGMILTLSASSPTNSDQVSGSHSVFNVIYI